jgi:Protein of unknown function (DUF3300)
MIAVPSLVTGLRRVALAMAVLLVAVWGGVSVQAEEAATDKPLSNEQLDQLVAPIALYPDSLISQILMAATYPLEVVEAARWSKENPNVKGQALEDAMQKQQWDPSVKALTAVPQTLAMMNDQLKWTQDLGDAFLAQQSDVLDAVQRLRARADAAGNLKSTPQQTVTRTNRPAGSPSSAPSTAYVIAPTNPTEYYVPIYDPGVVYGAWPYPTYEPFYWYPPGYVATGVFGFAAGVAVGAAIWGNVNWWNRNVNINVNRYNSFNRTRITNNTWTHNAEHRHGVSYNNARVSAQYGKGRDNAREVARQNMAGKGKGGDGGMRGKGQGGKGEGGMGGMAGGGMGQGGMAGGMSGGGMGSGGMGGMSSGGMGSGGMGSGGMAGGMGAGGMSGGMRSGGGHSGGGHAGGGMGFGGMGGGAHFAGMGGGGVRMGGMGGGGGRGRRSDMALKHDIALIGYLDNGLGFYRFAYNGSDTAYVGVMAQEVQRVAPEAVVRGRDGYLRVFYEKLGVKFQTYKQWLADGAQVPSLAHQH